MLYFGLTLGLIFLFYLLAKLADILIEQIKKIAINLRLSIFFMGTMLGLMTTLPEMSLGVNAIINDIENISYGNLTGGLMVLLALILGASIVAQKKIVAKDQLFHLPIILIYLALPTFLAFDGKVSYIDAIILVCGYVALIIHLYFGHRQDSVAPGEKSDRKEIAKDIIIGILCVIGIIILSNLIIRSTLTILELINLRPFFVGLVVFSIGTNLPEIIVAVRAWQSKNSSLSLSNLFGSAMGNVLMVGIFAFISPYFIPQDAVFYTFAAFIIVTMFLVGYFFANDKKFTRGEGYALLVIYFLFICTQIFLQYLGLSK